MQITDIRSWIVDIPWDHKPGVGTVRAPGRRTLLFVQVDTDEGITGWGEITTYPGPIANRATAAYVNEIGKWLRGEDPSRIEAVWHKIFRGMTYVGTRGATTAAISGIDSVLRAGFTARCQRADQRRGRRAGHADCAQLLQAGVPSL